MKLARNNRVFQVNMPVKDILALFTSPAFRQLLQQQGPHVKVNWRKSPFCVYIRSEIVPILQYLQADHPVMRKLQESLLHPATTT